jgi:1,4-dihydroxy-2-naphthoate octaprenyltransferase
VPRLEVPEALERTGKGYTCAVLTWVGEDGYPLSVAAGFEVDSGSRQLSVGPLPPRTAPPAGQEVGVTFSHIRPRPGSGYDQRRYVNLWGVASPQGDRVRVQVCSAHGWDEEELHFVEYSERSVGQAAGYLSEVGARPRLSPLWTVLLATRLPFLTATLVPVGLAGAVAGYQGQFRWGWFLAALAAAVAVHLGLNMANDLFDDLSGADRANPTPTPFSGGSRVLQHGLVSRRAMAAGCIGLYGLAVALGLALAATRSWWLVPVGALGLFLSLAYTGPPLSLVHRGLGEPVTALGFGPVMVMGTYLAVTGHWSWRAAYASLPVAVLIALVLYVNQVPDRRGDEAAGKRTLVVRFSPQAVRAGYLAGAGLAFALVAAGAAAGVMPRLTLLALAPAPLALRVHRDLAASYDRPFELLGAMQANIALHLLTGLCLIAGWALAAVA